MRYILAKEHLEKIILRKERQGLLVVYQLAEQAEDNMDILIIEIIIIAIMILNCALWYRVGWRRGYEKRLEVMTERLNTILKNVQYGINDTSYRKATELGKSKK